MRYDTSQLARDVVVGFVVELAVDGDLDAGLGVEAGILGDVVGADAAVAAVVRLGRVGDDEARDAVGVRVGGRARVRRVGDLLGRAGDGVIAGADAGGADGAVGIVAGLGDKLVGGVDLGAGSAEAVVLRALALLEVVDVDERAVGGAQLVELEVVLLLDLDPLVVADRHLLEVLVALHVEVVLHRTLALVQGADGLEVCLRVGSLEALALLAHLLDGRGDAVALAVQVAGLAGLRARQGVHLLVVALDEVVELRDHGVVARLDALVRDGQELLVRGELELADVLVLVALLLHQLGVVGDEAGARHEAVGGGLAGVLAGDAVEAVEADAVAVVAHTVVAAVVRAATGVVDLEVDQVGAER